MRIMFVRHGEPNYEKDCLTALGHLHAKAAAERLAGEGIEVIYSSPQGRALETARASALKLGIKDIKILDFMHEIFWGAKDGSAPYASGNPWLIADEMMAAGKELADANWPELPPFINNRITDEVKRVGREIDIWLKTLGYRREGAYYRQTGESENRRTVALFSHGGSSTAALSRILNQPFPYMCELLHMPFTAITVLRFDPKPGSLCLPHLELAGDARHINGIKLED